MNVKLFAAGLVFSKVGREAYDAGQKILGFAESSFDAAVDFDKHMRRIITLTEMSAGEFDNLKTGVIALSREVPQTANELADALYFITDTVADSSAAMHILDRSSKAAALGFAEVEDVAKALTATYVAYGGSLKDINRWTDELTAAVSVGKGEYGEYARGIGQVIPYANVLGIEFNEIASLMSVLTRRGYSVAEAATSLKNTMFRTIKPAEGAKKLYKELGITYGSAGIAAKGGFLPYLEDITKKTGENEEAIADLFPRMRALPTLYAILKDPMNDIANVFDVVGNSAGMMEQRFALAAEGSAHQLDIMKNALQEFKIAFGEAILPAVFDFLEPVMEKAYELLDWFKELPKEMQESIAKWTVFGGAALTVLGATMIGLGQILNLLALLKLAQVSVWGLFSIVLSPVNTGINLIKSGLMSLVGVFSKIGSVLGTFAKALFAALLHPVRSLSALFLGIKSAFSTLYTVLGVGVLNIIGWFKQFGSVTFFLQYAWMMLKGGMTGALAVFGKVLVIALPIVAAIAAIVGVVMLLIKYWDELKAVAMEVWGNMLAIIEPVMEQLRSAMLPLWESLKNLWEQLKPIAIALGAALLGALAVGLGLVIGFVTAIVSAMPGLVKAITGAIDFIAGIVGVVVNIFKLLWGLITFNKDLISDAWEGLLQNLVGIGRGIATFFSGLWDALKGLVKGFVQGIIDYFKTLYNTLIGNSIIPDLINGIVRWFAQLPGKVLQVVIGFVGNIVSRMANMRAEVLKVISNLVTSFLRTISSLGRQVWQAFTNVGTDIVSGLIRGITNSWRSLTSTLSNYISSLPATARRLLGIGSPSKVFAEVGKNISTGLAQGIKVHGHLGADALKEWMGSMTDAAKDFESRMGQIETTIAQQAKGISQTWDLMTLPTRKREEDLLSATEIRNVLADQVVVLRSWATNMDILRNRLGDTNQELLRYLADLGPSAFEMIATLAEASDKELQEIAKLFNIRLDIGFDQATKQSLPDIEDAIKEFAKALGPLGAGIGEELIVAIRKGIATDAASVGRTLSNITKLGVQGFEAFETKAKEALESIEKVAKEKATSAKGGGSSGGGGAAGAMKDFGIGIVDSFNEGIQMRLPDTSKWTDFLAQLPWNAVWRQTRMHPPYQLGSDFVNGYIKGLDMSSPHAEKVVETFANIPWVKVLKNYNERPISRESSKIARDFARGFDTGRPVVEKAVKSTNVDAVLKTMSANKVEISMFKVGENTALGFARGLKAKEPQVAAAARNIGSIAVKSASSSLLVRSPSKVFYDMGQNTAQGFINGIDSMAKHIDAAFREMVHSGDLGKQLKADASTLFGGAMPTPMLTPMAVGGYGGTSLDFESVALPPQKIEHTVRFEGALPEGVSLNLTARDVADLLADDPNSTRRVSRLIVRASERDER